MKTEHLLTALGVVIITAVALFILTHFWPAVVAGFAAVGLCVCINRGALWFNRRK